MSTIAHVVPTFNTGLQLRDTVRGYFYLDDKEALWYTRKEDGLEVLETREQIRIFNNPFEAKDEFTKCLPH